MVEHITLGGLNVSLQSSTAGQKNYMNLSRHEAGVPLNHCA